MYRSTATHQRSHTFDRWAAALLTLLFASPALASPQVVLHADGTVEATAITPGGSFAWSWAARVLDGWVSEVSLAASETFDDDRDGALRFEAPRVGWPIVLLVGVDTTTGAVTIATPAEDDDGIGNEKSADGPPAWQATLEVLDTVTVRRDVATGAFSRVAFPGDRARVLLVRPGTGAWHLALSDGGSLDRGDAADGLIVLALDDMDVLTPRSAPAPTALAPDDIVVVVDPQHMTAHTVVLSDASVDWDETIKSAEAAR